MRGGDWHAERVCGARRVGLRRTDKPRLAGGAPPFISRRQLSTAPVLTGGFAGIREP